MKTIFSILITLCICQPAAAALITGAQDKLLDYSPQVIGQLAPISTRLDKLAASEKSDGYVLERIDVEFGFSLEAGIKFFSSEAEKEVELIWEKKDKVAADEVIDVEIGNDSDETARFMLNEVLKHLSLKVAHGKRRQKIIQKLYRDARRIHRYIDAVRTFNGQENWYVGNYFKNYYFSATGDLQVVGVEYDKRLRFRFRTPTILDATPTGTRYERRIHRRLRKMAQHFNEIQSLDLVTNNFTMNRVRSWTDMELNFNLGIGEVSKGRGLLLEWFPAQEPIPGSSELKDPRPRILRSFANLFEKNIPDGELYELSQIRLSTSLTKGLEVLIFGKSISRNTEYHYRRR